MITGKHLSRRTLLRGFGIAIGLPMLDSMLPAFAPTTKAPLRMLFNYVPNGIVMKDWTPAAQGSVFDLPRLLQPMAAYRDKMLLVAILKLLPGAIAIATEHAGLPATVAGDWLAEARQFSQGFLRDLNQVSVVEPETPPADC